LQFEQKLTKRTGGVVWFEVFMAPLLDDLGRFFGATGIARDITFRKQAELALKEQLELRERLARIAAAVPGVIYSFRLRPDGSGCLPYASEAFEGFFGLKPLEVVEDASRAFTLVHPDDLPGLQASIAESARTMLPWRMEFRVRQPNQGEIWIEGQSTPEREADGCVLWHGFLSDITERKRTARQLIELEESGERSRRALEHERALHQIKSRFVSMVSHEFRTPLCVIGMAGSLLTRYLDRMTAAERSRQLEGIKTSVERMTRMMEDLLLFGNLESGKIECHPVRLNLPALCARLIAEASAQAEGARQVECVIEPGAREAFLDERTLDHLLGNLISNAFKYSSAGDPVRIEIKCCAGNPDSDAGGTAREPHIQIEVSDKGIGIPASDLAKLFQTFHRASNIGNRPGTGMGLAIVKQFVEIHRGTVAIESIEGKGTSVRVCLPVLSPVGKDQTG
jgi:hypothetical protein